MSDVLITPASSKIEFKDASNNIDGTVKLDSDGNLELTSNNGISFGDTSSDVFIGNGTDNVDLKFEADGSVTGTSGVTLTIGSTVSNVKIASDELSINSTSGVITATTFRGNLNGTMTVVDESSDTTCFPLFVNSTTGNVAPKTGSNLRFNSASGQLAATGLAIDSSLFAYGNLYAYGNIIGDGGTAMTGMASINVSSGNINASTFTGNGSALTGIVTEGVTNTSTISNLASSSDVMVGVDVGPRFHAYYNASNEYITISTGDASGGRNYGTMEWRTGRESGGTSVYGNNSGSTIKIAHFDGQMVLCNKSGNFGIGGSGHDGFRLLLDGTMVNASESGAAANFRIIRRDDGNALEFGDNSSSVIGSVTLDNSANTTTYNTSSDYRIKENVVGITSALDKINQLRPVNFNFIGKSVKLDGFIADEVQAVVPYAVHGEKDAVKTVKDGDLSDTGTKEDADRIAALPTKEVPDYQQVDYSKLVGLLTASIQELSAKNDALEARISALESGGS